MGVHSLETNCMIIWGFPQMGLPQQLDGLNYKILLKWMIWGYPPFQETLILQINARNPVVTTFCSNIFSYFSWLPVCVGCASAQSAPRRSRIPSTMTWMLGEERRQGLPSGKLTQTLKIAQFEWKLIFQPYLPGSMLIYWRVKSF